MTASERLRQAIRESGLTHYRVGHDTGVGIRSIDRFMLEGKTIRTDTFDTLCDYMGFELCRKKGRTGAKQPAKKGAPSSKRTVKKTGAAKRKAKKK
jgi:hypothetical protein